MMELRKGPSTSPPRKARSLDVLLREVNHRTSNDLQMVVSLLNLQSGRATNPETREALREAADRVAVLARARAPLGEQPTIETALRQVCVALKSLAKPRSILIAFEAAGETDGLSERQITTLALIVNELATNAIKHAYPDDGGGRVSITLRSDADGYLAIAVEDDGQPFPQVGRRNKQGLGLDLVGRLMDSIGGLFVLPANGSKRFEIRVPIESEKSGSLARKAAISWRTTMLKNTSTPHAKSGKLLRALPGIVFIVARQ